MLLPTLLRKPRLQRPTLLLPRVMLLLAMPRLRAKPPLPTLPRNRLLRRSKRLLYGLNGRADDAENPRLPPAVPFPEA